MHRPSIKKSLAELTQYQTVQTLSVPTAYALRTAQYQLSNQVLFSNFLQDILKRFLTARSFIWKLDEVFCPRFDLCY